MLLLLPFSSCVYNCLRGYKLYIDDRLEMNAAILDESIDVSTLTFSWAVTTYNWLFKFLLLFKAISSPTGMIYTSLIKKHLTLLNTSYQQQIHHNYPALSLSERPRVTYSSRSLPSRQRIVLTRCILH